MRRQVTTEQIIDTAQDGLKASLYIQWSGNVVKYYPASMTADVQPNPSDPRNNLETGGVVPEPWPVLLNVPIAWPRIGKFALVGPLTQGDPVTLEAFDVDPTTTWAQGRSIRPVAPVDVRRLSGNYWKATPANLTGPIADAAQLGALVGMLGIDGDTAQILFAAAALTIGKSGAQVTIAGGASALVPAPWATALDTALSSFTAALALIPAPMDPATTQAAAAGILTAAQNLGTALGALPPDATTATKAT